LPLSLRLDNASLRNTSSQSSPALTRPVEGLSVMKLNVFAVGAVWLLLMVPLVAARAQVCASGLYRAGCAGPNGAVAVSRPPSPYYHPAAPRYAAATPYYHSGGSFNCASGAYHAGCAGRRGAVVVRKPY
jgi:hypothetical protein